ncbi:hypothetical protein JW848_02020 [Candidatus Bipolaricaulota bacterium]|nr:hypothetical protein [Candidatus Bipolaricaulota bacterium]
MTRTWTWPRCALWLVVLVGVGGMAANGQAATADAPMVPLPVAVRLEATLDLDGRTIRGTAHYDRLGGGADRAEAVFLLMANLDRQPNPALSAVSLDDRYESGVEPASTTITSVQVRDSNGDVDASFRLAALPEAWQTYSLEDTLLIVTWDAGSSDEITIAIEFITQVPRMNAADQTVNDDVLTWRFGWFPVPFTAEISPPAEETSPRLLDPSAALPIQLPALDLAATVYAAADVTMMFGADHAERIDHGSGETATYVIANDHPVRTLAMSASRDHLRYTLWHEAMPIDVYYRAGHQDTARILATQAADIVTAYEPLYGSYPRSRLTIVENADTSGTSIAADGIVWLSGLFFTHRNVTMVGILDRLTEFVLAHEIAHQWWGIGIGVDLNAENWLSEALAQYLSVGYFEDRYGAEGGNVFQPKADGVIQSFVASQLGFYNLREHQIELPYVLAHAQGFDEAIVKPFADVQYDNETAVRLYDKGYLVARAIASAIGPEVFDRALAAAWERYGFGTISVDGLQDLVEEASDPEVEVDIANLFDVWLREPTSVDYAVRIVGEERPREDGTYTTTVEAVRDGGTVQPVVVDVMLASGKHVQQVWDGADSAELLTFVTDSPVRRATIDPGHFLPDVHRLNNHDPVLLVTSTGENAYPLDAYLVRPSITPDGVSISFLDRFVISWLGDTAAASARIGRNHLIELQAGLLENDLQGSVGYRYLGYTPMTLGGVSTTWIPTHTVSIEFDRFITSGGPLAVVGLSAGLLPSVARNYASGATLDLIPNIDPRYENGLGNADSETATSTVAARLSVAAEQASVIGPQLRFLTAVSLGFAVGELPSPLWFELDELHSFGEMVDGTWSPAAFRGTHKVFVRLAVELPAMADFPYDLLGLMMVDHARARVFAAAGSSWTSGGGFGTTPPSVEAGVETLIDLSALGGLLPATLKIGYAAPIVGKGQGVLYVGVSL